MNGKIFLSALVTAFAVAARCQHYKGDTEESDKALAECDSIIKAYVDSLNSENILMIEYMAQAEYIGRMHDAYAKKEQLLEERIIDHSEGDMKLFLYKEFEREHRLYDAWAEQNDSIIYATEPFGAPWIECRCQRIDKLEEHIKILEKHAQRLSLDR